MDVITKKELYELIAGISNLNNMLRTNMESAHDVSKRLDADTFKKFKTSPTKPKWPYLVPEFKVTTPSRFPNMQRLRKVSEDKHHIDKDLVTLVKGLDDTIYLQESTPKTKAIVAIIIKTVLAYYWELQSYRIVTLELLKLKYPDVKINSIPANEHEIPLSSVSPIDDFSLKVQLSYLKKEDPQVDYKRLLKSSSAIASAIKLSDDEHNKVLQKSYETVVRAFVSYMDKPGPAMENLLNIVIGQYERARRV